MQRNCFCVSIEGKLLYCVVTILLYAYCLELGSGHLGRRRFMGGPVFLYSLLVDNTIRLTCTEHPSNRHLHRDLLVRTVPLKCQVFERKVFNLPPLPNAQLWKRPGLPLYLFPQRLHMVVIDMGIP